MNLLRQTGFVSLLALASISAFAQSGNYVFSESGAAAGASYARIGTFLLDASGSVSGVEYLRTTGVSSVAVLSGRYEKQTDGSIMVYLETPATTDDGNPVRSTLRLAAVSPTKYSGIRVDPGFTGTAEVYSAPKVTASAARPALLVEEGGADSNRTYTVMGALRFDGKNGVSGTLVRKTAGTLDSVTVAGSVTVGADNVSSLMFQQSTSSDDDEEATAQTFTYFAIPVDTQNWVALRTDAGNVGLAKITAQ